MVSSIYVVLLVESITTWPHSRIAASFVVVTMVCLWRESPSTCSSPEVPSRSWAANFPSSFRAGSSCCAPCSSSCNSLSISNLSSLMSQHLYRLITVHTLFLLLPHFVPSSPYYKCHHSCLMSGSFNRPVANTDFERLLTRFMDFNKIHFFLFFLFFHPTESSF